MRLILVLSYRSYTTRNHTTGHLCTIKDLFILAGLNLKIPYITKNKNTSHCENKEKNTSHCVYTDKNTRHCEIIEKKKIEKIKLAVNFKKIKKM